MFVIREASTPLASIQGEGSTYRNRLLGEHLDEGFSQATDEEPFNQIEKTQQIRNALSNLPSHHLYKREDRRPLARTRFT